MESSTKVVLVTGASSGIGEAVALRLAGEGHQVLAGARRRTASPRSRNTTTPLGYGSST